MAKSKKAKQRAQRARAHEARAHRHAEAAAAKEHHHLPHAGTPENQAYLRRRRVEDLLAFGEFRRARGPWPVVVGVAVALLFALGIVMWVLLV